MRPAHLWVTASPKSLRTIWGDPWESSGENKGRVRGASLPGTVQCRQSQSHRRHTALVAVTPLAAQLGRLCLLLGRLCLLLGRYRILLTYLCSYGNICLPVQDEIWWQAHHSPIFLPNHYVLHLGITEVHLIRSRPFLKWKVRLYSQLVYHKYRHPVFMQRH